MKKLLSLLFLLTALPALADFRVTVSVTVTNGTTNGQTFVVNGNTRTWTNSVQSAPVQVLTNSTANGAKTNLLTQIQTYTFSGPISSADAGSSNFVIYGALNQVMTVTPSLGWALVSYSTQTVTAAYTVRVPGTAEAAGPRTNIYSLLTTAINDSSTNSFYENATAVQNLLGKTNDQTIAGIKQFTNVQGHWRGQVTSTNLNGTAGNITNGLFKTNIFAYPTLTNGVNYGAAFRSPGSADFSEQFGTGAASTGDSSIALGNTAQASGASSVAVGSSANATAEGAIAVGFGPIATASGALAIGYGAASAHTNSTAVGFGATTTTSNQLRLGTSSQFVSIPGNLHVIGSSTNNTMRGTNVFPTGSDVSFGRYALTTIAAGVNSINVGTNVFVELSGTALAFSIVGIDGQPNRDGKLLILLNQTGAAMTIGHDSGLEATAANRIYTMTGADKATTGNGAVMLIYNSNSSRWILINLED